jgi:hypothetical protein
MPDYEIRGARDLDTVWSIGPNLPDKEYALHVFNHTNCKCKGVGPFTFDETNFSADYYLVERTSLEGDVWHALYEQCESGKCIA